MAGGYDLSGYLKDLRTSWYGEDGRRAASPPPPIEEGLAQSPAPPSPVRVEEGAGEGGGSKASSYWSSYESMGGTLSFADAKGAADSATMLDNFSQLVPAVALPDMPRLPDYPSVSLPSYADMPSVSLPSMADLPSLPSMDDIPSISMPSYADAPSVSLPTLPEVPSFPSLGLDPMKMFTTESDR
jgi:hypothetical protein